MKFTYISEILQDKRFKLILNDAIEEETHRRNNRLVVFESKNLELRRNTFIRLDEQGLMTVEWLTAEFESIGNKSSKLSANERQFVWSIVDGAIIKTIEYYNNRPFEKIKRRFYRIFKIQTNE
jgi:hypothetical protein